MTNTIQYTPDFLDNADDVFNYLYDHVPWEKTEVKVYGKTYLTPRKTAWYSKDGKSYSYSNNNQITHPYCNVIADLNSKVGKFLGLDFNSVLLNLYEDGSNHVSWHSDNEKELGDEINIASISLGVSRDFKYRTIKDKSLVKTISLEHGSLLVMRHPFQLNYQHCVPKRKKVVSKRINLTFRSII